MRVAVDISLYPLDQNFIPPIKDFIARINQYKDIEVETNAMSTQLRGEYDVVMDALKQEMGASFLRQEKAVFALKILNNPLP